MSAVAFDTHAFVKRLTSVGMPEAQAEILADEQVRLIDERLATKTDIARLEAATKADIARLEAATKADIAVLGADIARLEAATKTDIARLENATKRDIREAELEAKIDASKSETLKWMIGSMGFQTIVILGAVFALVPLFVH
jgi:hypothetical protein